MSKADCRESVAHAGPVWRGCPGAPEAGLLPPPSEAWRRAGKALQPATCSLVGQSVRFATLRSQSRERGGVSRSPSPWSSAAHPVWALPSASLGCSLMAEPAAGPRQVLLSGVSLTRDRTDASEPGWQNRVGPSAQRANRSASTGTPRWGPVLPSRRSLSPSGSSDTARHTAPGNFPGALCRTAHLLPSLTHASHVRPGGVTRALCSDGGPRLRSSCAQSLLHIVPGLMRASLLRSLLGLAPEVSPLRTVDRFSARSSVTEQAGRPALSPQWLPGLCPCPGGPHDWPTAPQAFLLRRPLALLPCRRSPLSCLGAPLAASLVLWAHLLHRPPRKTG